MSFKTEDAQYLVDHLVEKSGAMYDLSKALVETRTRAKSLEAMLEAAVRLRGQVQPHERTSQEAHTIVADFDRAVLALSSSPRLVDELEEARADGLDRAAKIARGRERVARNDAGRTKGAASDANWFQGNAAGEIALEIETEATKIRAALNTKISPVVERAIARFGKRDGMAILLNATCFPLSDTDAMKQLEELIRRADAGASVGQLIAKAEAEHERETSELDAAQAVINSPPGDK